jgi:hypothetical protein
MYTKKNAIFNTYYGLQSVNHQVALDPKYDAAHEQAFNHWTLGQTMIFEGIVLAKMVRLYIEVMRTQGALSPALLQQISEDTSTICRDLDAGKDGITQSGRAGCVCRVLLKPYDVTVSDENHYTASVVVSGVSNLDLSAVLVGRMARTLHAAYQAQRPADAANNQKYTVTPLHIFRSAATLADSLGLMGRGHVTGQILGLFHGRSQFRWSAHDFRALSWRAAPVETHQVLQRMLRADNFTLFSQKDMNDEMRATSVAL